MFDRRFLYRQEWPKGKSTAKTMWLHFLCPFPHYSASGDADVFSLICCPQPQLWNCFFSSFAHLLQLFMAVVFSCAFALPGCRQCPHGEDVEGVHGIPWYCRGRCPCVSHRLHQEESLEAARPRSASRQRWDGQGPVC